MKTIGFVLAVLVSASVLHGAEPLLLSKNSRTDYTIVVGDAATPVEQTAARELKEHLDSVTGAGFIVVTESEADATKPQLVVGNSKRMKELLPALDVTKIKDDGIVIKSAGQNIVFVGHPRRGTLYAVNTFLEDVVGIRWWTSTESFIPKRPTLEIPEQNVEYAPKLIYREAYYRDAFDGVFASRMKCNGNMVRTTPEYGGHYKFQHFVHSFFPLLPPEKYFKDHPEWYSEIDGKRKHEHAQLCLTNDAMRAELTKNALEGLRKNPDAGFISISQNDWYGSCTCDPCKAVDDEEGSQAGTLIRFVNKVAEEIEKEFPDVWVETLAYQYTRKPPKLVKPRKNVVIRLCTIECSFVQPLESGEQNKPLREDMQGWSKIADNLFVWDYTVNFSAYMLPHPNHRVLASNVRFFVDNNTIGLFAQGDSFCTAGDFARLKTWVLSRLMWNPSLDENKLFHEFVTGYYGPDAAPIIEEYRKLILDEAEKSGVYLKCFMNTTSDWLDSDTLSKAVALMDKAVAAAKDDTVRNRIRRDRLPIDLVFMKEYHSLKRQAALNGKSFVGPENPQTFFNDFFARCKEFGVTAYREGDGPKQFEAFEENMRRRFGPAAPSPEFCTKLSTTNWLDIQDYEFNLHRFGTWTFSVDDAQASNKRAAKMPGDHFEWATSYNFDDSITELKPTGEPQDPPVYRLYAAVRCDAQDGIEGNAMTLGVYDYETKKGVTSKTLSVPEIRGPEYRWIDMGSIPLKPKQNFWFAPPKRPGEVDAVYIDRVVVVREH